MCSIRLRCRLSSWISWYCFKFSSISKHNQRVLECWTALNLVVGAIIKHFQLFFFSICFIVVDSNSLTYYHVPVYMCKVYKMLTQCTQKRRAFKLYVDWNVVNNAYLYVQYCMAANVFLSVHHVPNRRLMQHKLRQPLPIQCITANRNLQQNKWTRKKTNENWIEWIRHTQ